MAKASAPGVEKRVVRYAALQPEWGQFTVASAMRGEGLQISPSGVRAIWRRHGLETLTKRIEAMAAGNRRAGTQLDERQRDHLARIRRRQAHQGAAADPAAGGEPLGRRDLLLRVAAEEFGRHGYRGAALKAIAGRAGILPGSMYHYFDSKQDLFEQVHRAGFQELNARVDAALADLHEPVERLRAACRAHLQLLLSGSSLSGFVRVRLFAPAGSALDARLMRDRRRYEARFRALVEAVPLAPGIDRSVLRLGLLGAINWTQVWYRPGRMSPEQIADEMVRIFTGTARRHAAPRQAAGGRRRG